MIVSCHGNEVATAYITSSEDIHKSVGEKTACYQALLEAIILLDASLIIEGSCPPFDLDLSCFRIWRRAR